MEVVNTTGPVNMYNNLNNFILNPMVFIIVLLIVISYYAFSSSSLESSGLGNGSSDNDSQIFGVIIIVIIIFLALVNALQYFFNTNVYAYIQGLFSPEPKIDIVVDQSTYQPNISPEIKFQNKKQVFNIPGNYYSYNDAKALCSAYGAKLASYDQIEKAYNNGAEWCNYGWSDNQLALFPTQKKTYNNLQKKPGHENACGRPGVNGGYIANPNIKFGVNCYGNKPNMRSDEEELMKTLSPYPETSQDITFQKNVDSMKNKLDKILISPFNYNTWDEM